VFTDTFTLRDSNNKLIDIDSSNIAWKSDVEYKYKNGDSAALQAMQWLDVTDCKLI